MFLFDTFFLFIRLILTTNWYLVVPGENRLLTFSGFNSSLLRCIQGHTEDQINFSFYTVSRKHLVDSCRFKSPPLFYDAGNWKTGRNAAAVAKPTAINTTTIADRHMSGRPTPVSEVKRCLAVRRQLLAAFLRNLQLRNIPGSVCCDSKSLKHQLEFIWGDIDQNVQLCE